MRMRNAAVVIGLVASACGGGSDTERATREGSTETVSTGGPRVASQYQKSIDRAWQTAIDGENPYKVCAGLKGMTLHIFSGEDEEAKAEAREAVDACSVPVSVQYFLSYIDGIPEGKHSCIDLVRETALIGAMITTVAEEDQAATQGREDRILEGIAPRVREVCPEVAYVIH